MGCLGRGVQSASSPLHRLHTAGTTPPPDPAPAPHCRLWPPAPAPHRRHRPPAPAPHSRHHAASRPCTGSTLPPLAPCTVTTPPLAPCTVTTPPLAPCSGSTPSLNALTESVNAPEPDAIYVFHRGESHGVLRSRQDEKQRAAAEGLGRRGEQDAEWDGEWDGEQDAEWDGEWDGEQDAEWDGEWRGA
ncbi:unnamed protein product [Gadus morhua 'NCC']